MRYFKILIQSKWIAPGVALKLHKELHLSLKSHGVPFSFRFPSLLLLSFYYWIECCSRRLFRYSLHKKHFFFNNNNFLPLPKREYGRWKGRLIVCIIDRRYFRSRKKIRVKFTYKKFKLCLLKTSLLSIFGFSCFSFENESEQKQTTICLTFHSVAISRAIFNNIIQPQLCFLHISFRLFGQK